MISAERLIEEARRAAEQWRAEQTARDAETQARNERQEAEYQTKQAAFEEQKPELANRARQEHQARFQPLQEILDHFVGTLQSIRDEYCPNSPIVVVDQYEGYYDDAPIRKSDNTYSRALMIIDSTSPTHKEVIAIYAVAIEPAGRKFIFGPAKDTRFAVAVEHTYFFPEDGGPRFLERAKSVQEDMVCITPDDDLFTVFQDTATGQGKISFRSFGIAPSISHLKPNMIPFGADKATFGAIADKLTNILVQKEIQRQKEPQVTNVPRTLSIHRPQLCDSQLYN